MQKTEKYDKLTKRAWLIFLAVVVVFFVYLFFGSAYSPKNIAYNEGQQCSLLENFLEEQAKEEYGGEWYKYCIVDEVTVEDHKWYEIKPYSDGWVYRVTFKTSDEVKYYQNAPEEIQKQYDYPAYVEICE